MGLNDSEMVEVVAGENGSRKRLREDTGELFYGYMTPAQLQYAKDHSWKLSKDTGNARKLALEYGLPEQVRGNPLACGCRTAALAGATKMVMGFVEADYMCSFGYHNFMVFKVRGVENKGQTKLKIVNGEVVESSDNTPGELGEF